MNILMERTSKHPLWTGTIIGLIIGLLVGWLVLGWWLFPVQYTGGAYSYELTDTQKLDYLRLAIDDYSGNQQMPLLQQRLWGWKEKDKSAYLARLYTLYIQSGQQKEAQRVLDLSRMLSRQEKWNLEEANKSLSKLLDEVGKGSKEAKAIETFAGSLGLIMPAKMAEASTAVTSKPAESQPGQPGEVLPPPENAQPGQPEDGQPAEPGKPAEAQPVQPPDGQVGKPVEAQPVPPADGQPVKPGKPIKPEDVNSGPNLDWVPAVIGGILLAIIISVFLFWRKIKSGASFDFDANPEDAAFSGEGRLSPIKKWMCHYSLGMDSFDEAYTIEGDDGIFLGECGIGISEILGPGDPKRVVAFETWLFDKSEIRTETKVLVGEYAYNDDFLRARLASKGELILAKPGLKFDISSDTLCLKAQVDEMTYSQDSPSEAYFASLTMQLAAYVKTGDVARTLAAKPADITAE